MSLHRRQRPGLAVRLLAFCWRALRIFLVAFAAMGPGPPPMPPPPQPQIVLREEKGAKHTRR